MFTLEEQKAAIAHLAAKTDPAMLDAAAEIIGGIASDVMSEIKFDEAIVAIENLVRTYGCNVQLKNVPPMFVPAGYEKHKHQLDNAWYDYATKIFETGGVVTLDLLPF